MNIRVGIGYDLHRFVEGRKLWLGGIEIPYIKGLMGHSDADVVLHAIASAILGAIGAGDLGHHFPDSDSKWKNASSQKLLQHVMTLVGRGGFKVGNIDVMVLAEEPRLEPFKVRMAEKVAAMVGVSKKEVNIKATTSEGIGPIGHKEAMAAYAVVLVEKRKKRK